MRREAFESLRESALKTARAWALKEGAMSLWDSKLGARDGWRAWYAWAIRSRLENRDRFRTAIYFHCGGLDLYPTAATP